MEQWIIDKAKSVGITDYQGMSKTELIRNIQLREGFFPCIGTDWCNPSRGTDCCWKEHCEAETFSL